MSNPDFFLPPDLVARALANLAEREHDAINVLSEQPEQGEPSVKEELAFRLRDYNAYIKASFEWGKGIRPILSPRGAWLVPSRTTGGVVYEVSRANGYWQCGPNCKCPQFHWHTALALGIERAMEMADEEDDGLDLEPAEPSAEDVRALRSRIAREAARQMNELFSEAA